MLFIFLILFSWSSVEATNMLSSQKYKKSNYFLTIPSRMRGNSSRKGFLDITPPPISKLDPNINHYDWSLSNEHIFEIGNYNYKDPWWITIRDNFSKKHGMVSKPLIYTTEFPSGSDEHGVVRGHKDLTRIGKVFIDVPESAFKERSNPSGKGGFKLDDDDIGGNLTGIKDSALKRNKQIQRMQLELASKTKEAAKPIAEIVEKMLGADLEKHKQNRSLNFLYNKVVENLQFNVGEDKATGLGGLVLEDVIKKYYGLNAQTPNPTNTVESVRNQESRWEHKTTRIPRQGTPTEAPIPPGLESPSTTPAPIPPGFSPANQPPKEFRLEIPPVPVSSIPHSESPAESPKIHTMETPREWTAYETPPKDGFTESWIPHTSKLRDWLSGGDPSTWNKQQEPDSNMVEKLKGKMKFYRMGFFTIFLAELSMIIANKPESEVRLMGLSFEKEYELLTTQDKYILSFGEPFLSWFQTLVTKFASLPPDYVKDRASVFSHQAFYRRQLFPEELNRILDFIDHLYEENEGIDLFKAVEQINKFPYSTNNFKTMRNLSKAVFAPYIRLTGSFKRQMLIESVNKFLTNFNPRPPYYTGVPLLRTLNSTKIVQRRFSNKTRFSIVGRNDDVETNEIKFKKPTAWDERYYEREKHKSTDGNDKRQGVADKRLKTAMIYLKKQSGKYIRSTAKYPTTRRKLNTREELKQKFQKKPHNTYEKKGNSKALNSNKGIVFAKVDNYEKKTKIKAKIPKGKLLNDTSETDYSDHHYSNETDYTDDIKTSYDDTGSTSAFKEDERHSSKTPKPKTTSKTYPVKILTSSDKYNGTTRTLKLNKQSTWKNVKDINIDEEIVKMEANMNANKYGNINIVTPIPYNNEFKSNEGYYSSSYKRKDTKVEPTIKFKSENKNIIQDLTSYSDEEETLKFKLSDTLRHSKEYLPPNRRSNHVRRHKKRIHEFSSYSSEEVVLKSNIYKALGLENFTAPKEVVLRTKDEVSNYSYYIKYNQTNVMSRYIGEKVF